MQWEGRGYSDVRCSDLFRALALEWSVLFTYPSCAVSHPSRLWGRGWAGKGGCSEAFSTVIFRALSFVRCGKGACET